MTAGKTLSYDRVYIALGVLAFACWCALILKPVGLPFRGLDFRIFYTAASLPLDQLYDLETQARFQEELWREYGSYVTSPFPQIGRAHV